MNSDKVNVLLLGSGGRESALAWKLSQSSSLGKLWIAPGNGGTDVYGVNVPIKPTDFEAIEEFVKANGVDLIIPGNEDPLVAGIYDYFEASPVEVLVAGPSREGARLEGSKEFAKEFMGRHGIPTARHLSVTPATYNRGVEFLETLSAPYVLKADGLAAGKGVLIINDLDEARKALGEMLDGMFGDASATVVIEEFLSGIECSVFVLTDGAGEYRVLPVAKDYKRVGEGDTGLNTGGMGAVSPVPFADDEFMAKVEERIIRPTVEGLRAEGIVYRGFIFLGLINVGGEPMVIEYNVRMGDPETEVVMPRLQGDLVKLLVNTAQGNLGDEPAGTDPQPAVTVMMVSGGYPGSYPKGKKITGLENVTESVLFHAGTAKDTEGNIITAGGRVIAATSRGETIAEALERSYRSVGLVEFDGKYFRRDIGNEFIK